MITEESMEEISSASDGDLEDGEIIDDSDSDLSIFNIINSRQQESKHPSANRVTGSDIHLIPLRSLSPKKRLCKSKENKNVDPDSFNLLIKIPGKVESTKVKEVRPRRKTRCHHRRKKNKIYEDWSRSISLLTSPKKRKKTNASPHKYDSCESLNKEWRSSKKACPEPKLNPVITKGNALLTKLVSTGDISPSSIILKEKNQKNVEKASILQCVFADIDTDNLVMEKSVETPSVFCSVLSDVSSDELAAGMNVEKSSGYRSTFSDISSDELVSHNLTMKNCHSNCEHLFESPNSGSSPKSVKVSHRSVSPHENCTVYIDEASKTSEISPVKSLISERSNDSILVHKNVPQLNLELLETPPQCDDVYSPETFIPFNLNDPQNSETLEFHTSLGSENDFLSENYDCIPMSCSEDEEVSNDSKTEKQKDFLLKPPQNEEDEEEEELRLRISALKTWLQRKYAKSKPSRNIKSNNDNTVSQETSNIDQLPHMTENLQSQSVETNLISKQNEETKMENCGDKEGILEPEEVPPEPKENSFIDDEASENYEQALRSLLVSNLLKKKLKNSNELLSESCLINKASSSLELLNKPPSKNPHKASSNSRSSNSFNIASSSSKCRTVSSIKNSNQALKNSANKSDSINCDNFQSKYVFSNFYEPPNQLEDSKYLSSISNFKLPVVDKFIIHLSEDSDYDSDESVTKNVTKTLLDKKSVGPSENNCLKRAAVKSTMDVPNPSRRTKSPSEPCLESTTADHSSSVNNFEECDSVKWRKSLGEESKQLPAESVPNNQQIKVTSNTSFEVENCSNAAEFQVGELPSNISAAIVWNSIEESAGPQESDFTSSPEKIASDLPPIHFNGNYAPFQAQKAQELAIISNTHNAKEKSKKANSALVADVLVPLEKKLLKSRLNMLQNVGSMQSCVNSCEENALKCSKSFSKIVQLQKALKQATSDYKTHFSSLKTCLQGYKAHSEKISSCLKDYALAQKDCVKTGKQIIGPNYKTPKEGMSAMATKFKLLKEKKMELLNNASIASEIKKANFSTDASSTTISAALKNINLNHRSTTSSENVSHDRIPSTRVVETGQIPHGHLSNFSKDLNVSGKTSTKNSPKEALTCHSVIKETTCNQENFIETTSLPTTFDESTQSTKEFRGSETIVDELRRSGDMESNATETSASVQCGAKVTQPEVDESSSAKTDSMTRILSPPPLPKPLLAMLDVMDPQKSESDEIFECQQKFKKYTPVFQSLYRDSNGIRNDNVDRVICPFSLQGTCRDETCEYKHLLN